MPCFSLQSCKLNISSCTTLAVDKALSPIKYPIGANPFTANKKILNYLQSCISQIFSLLANCKPSKRSAADCINDSRMWSSLSLLEKI